MKVSALEESAIQSIGRAFACYDYKGEPGLIDAFPRRSAAAAFICGYVRMALQSGLLHTSGPRGEGYIAYRLPGEKVGLKPLWQLARGMFDAMNFKQIVNFFRIMVKGGQGLEDRMKKKKKPYIFVGMVCVLEQYQGQGYMRKLLDMAFAEGNRLHVPVILDTDAKSKCDKYVHLGMQLAGTRHFGDHGVLYDLIKYPDD